jgi:predicted Fe-S protein YdhL (DUF1289 family)
MSDDIWKRNEPSSPCVKICSIHPGAGLCVGCLRSLPEIAAWSSLSAADRSEILAQLPARGAAARRVQATESPQKDAPRRH